ncbi:DUF6612 family protein [Paenibacillus pinistramenti]|uniref:DUF6612 family protein n=1 Tax=Paenibacillus pinistramenti TaxID=1768003 RepID=UPI001108E03B|nr:DUF6612 family protein [Paenibacillus pinistramenti]
MKKLAVILAGLMLTAGLTACGSKEETESAAAAAESSSNAAVETASTNSAAAAETDTGVPTVKELIQKVTEAGTGLKSFAMDSTIDENVTMTIDGEQQTQNISMKTKQEMVKEPFAIYQEVTSNLPDDQGGGTIKQYITQDGIYSQVNGSWMKLPDESAAPILEQMKNAGSPEQQFKQFESIADKAEVTDQGDVYLLKANLSGNGVKELAKSFLLQNEGANEQTEQLLEQMDIKSLDMSYTVDKKTYYPVDINVNMEMGMTVEEQEVSMIMKMAGKVSKANEIGSIEIPAEVTGAAE